MNLVVKTTLIVCLFPVFAYAAETVGDFNFKTLDGKIIEYKAGNKTPLVVNVGSHW